MKKRYGNPATYYVCMGKNGIHQMSWEEYCQLAGIDPTGVALCEWDIATLDDYESKTAGTPLVYRCPLVGCKNYIIPFWPVET